MFQYNLRTLMLVMLGACVLTWLFFVLPGEISIVMLLCLFMVVPSAVIAGILYFRGYPQAFSIGCVPPILLFGGILMFEGWPFGPFGRGDEVEVKIMILICMLVVIAAGGASAGVRWLAVWSRQPAAQAKTFPGLPIDLAQLPPSAAHGSAGASPSRPLPSRSPNPEP